MATISSTMRLVEQTTAPIQRTIDSMNRMINVMEKTNSIAKMPELSAALEEFRHDADVAQNAVNELNQELDRMSRHSSGIDRIRGGFEGMGQAVVVANQGLQLARQAYEGISKLGTEADKRISVDARLNLINDGSRTQEQFESQVMAAANAARSDYESTAALVATMGRQDIFAGNNDAAIAFSKTINEGLAVSGASASEVSSVLIQLSQGIASGVLRGDEFNSVMENGSVIAEMMAKSLGVTKGQLREMAQEGELTADVVVSSIMQQADAIEEQFQSMPVTYGQAMNLLHNQASQLFNSLSQPGRAIDVIIGKIESLNAWLNTAQGQAFFDGITAGIDLTISGIAALADLAGETYLFFADNWGTVGPIFGGIASFVGVLTAAFLVYKGTLAAVAVVQGLQGAALMLATGATLAETAAQWGLNTALLACPVTWIVIAIAAVVAAIVGLTLWIIHLWKTNIDFKVGVIGIWNGILGFFDQVPIFFMGIGYGIADGFSYAKEMTLQILEGLVNGAIDRINRLIELANRIPGVSINAIDHVEFAAQAAAEEEMARAGRAANLADKKAQAALKAAERERRLLEKETRWRAEAAAEEAAAKEQDHTQESGHTQQPDPSDYEFPPVELSGGSIDKVGKIGDKVDLSDQSLEYFHDIAEIQALGNAGTYATQYYDTGSTYTDYSQSIQNFETDNSLSYAGDSVYQYEAHHEVSNYGGDEYRYGPQSNVEYDMSGINYSYGAQNMVQDAYNTQTQLYNQTASYNQSMIQDAYNTQTKIYDQAASYNQSMVQDAYNTNTAYQYESVTNQIGGTQTYIGMDSTLDKRMDPDKASALSQSAGQGNVFYLEYHGGVSIHNDIQKTEDWETIKQSIYEEAESDVENGISDIEEVLYQ